MGTALAFLTVLPVRPRSSDRPLSWFPWVGWMLGLLLGGVGMASTNLHSAFLPAALVLAADLAVTGMIHLDGLIDSADGLMPHADRERRLAIMAEPTVGSFGVGAAIAVLIIRWSALGTVAGEPILLGALWCLSRTFMVAVIASVPHARPDGGMAAMLGKPNMLSIAAGAATAAVGIVFVVGTFAPLLLALALGAGWAVIELGRRRVGGYTGDVLGAACLVLETVGLVVASARF